jgi:tetratricopeptide (TPR) repeat protein
MQKIMSFSAMLLLLSVCLRPAISAGSENYNSGISDYNAGKYARALAQFESCQAAYPNNAMVHYYKALCLQSMGRFEQAKQEYRWVADRGDARLKSMAKTGLNQLSCPPTNWPSSKR